MGDLKFMSKIEKAIQFLVSPQRDFIGHLPPDTTVPPNELHVGPDAIRKLRGEATAGSPDPFVDTTRLFFDPAIPGTERVHLILDEDWHNSNHPEFMFFGRHCVKGTEGAKLVGDLDDYRWQDNVHVIRANSMNVAHHPHYEQIMASIIGDTRPEHIRVGVYGVWTNVKVEYLLFNLQTLPPFFSPAFLGICEPLTATPNQRWHAAALEKFEMLGYQVFDNIPDYLRWMGLEIA